MTLREALELTRGIRISDDETDLCFKAMVIFWIGANYNYDKVKTAKTTRYNECEVDTVLVNWAQSEILVDGVIHGEFDGENDWMEVILIAMCGAGEIVRRSGSENDSLIYNDKTNKFDTNMANPKTLNEHLFAQLDRLSSANESNIKTEVEKASNIVMVSEQILNVARLKLDIMQAAGNLSEFSEIDTMKELPPIEEDSNSDKKKLTA